MSVVFNLVGGGRKLILLPNFLSMRGFGMKHMLKKAPDHLISGVKAPEMNDKISYASEQSFGRSIRQ